MRYSTNFIITILIIVAFFLSNSNNNCLAHNNSINISDTSVLNNSCVQGEIIIKFKPEAGKISPELAKGLVSVGISSVDVLFNRVGATQIKKIFEHKKTPANRSLPDLSRIYALKVPMETDVKAIARELSRNPNIEYAEPRHIYQLFDVPNDSLYPQQWYLPKVEAPAAWDISQGDTNVVIGIIDTGVDWDHPDLAANIWENEDETGFDDQGNDKRTNGLDDDNNGFIDDWHGWDFFGDVGNTQDNDPMDVIGHGTHCAGIASAVTNNVTGIAGLGRNCKIMPVKVAAGIITKGPEGIIYATDNGCDIINLSWGGDPPTSFLNDAIQYAHLSGTFVIAAAGNDNTSVRKYPAAYTNVFAVAATNMYDKKASFSSYGSFVDVSAPGYHMMSTVCDDDYDYMSGTSMAAPLTAGLAGLLKSLYPNWTNEQIANQIIESADNIDNLNSQYAGLLGSGRINALNALTYEAVPKIEYQDFSIDDNQNGVPDPGESVNITVALKNTWGNAGNVSVTLSTSDYAVTITNGVSNYGDIPGGSTVENNAFPFSFTVNEISTIHKVEFVLDICADGGYNTIDTFSVIIGRPSILLVDDDCDGNNVEKYYIASLDSLGFAHDYWHHSIQGSPSINTLSNYSTVIWFTELAFPTLNADDINNLKSYLDNGGNLFMTGQDIGWDFNDPMGFCYGDPFYPDYLHAGYIADNSNILGITGISDDPISNDLLLYISGGDGANNQLFPDVIEPKPEASAIFNYSSDGCAGIKYSGNYKIVYLGFGFEAIDDLSMRNTVLNNVIDWLNGLSMFHDPLPDTEDTINPYSVSAQVSSTVSLSELYVYWKTEGATTFSRIQMEPAGENEYLASIPAQQSGAQVVYFIYVVDANGFSRTLPLQAPNHIYTFYVGTDNMPPVIEHAPLENTIDEEGPYCVITEITDNIGVDPNSVFLHYNKNGGITDSIPMQLTPSPDQYEGIIPGPVPTSDFVNYYITAGDSSSGHNFSRLPDSGYFSFSIVNDMLIDDFESGSSKWDLGTGWGITETSSPSGTHCITDSPFGYYGNNENNPLTLLLGLSLSTYKTATLGYYTRHSFANGDTGMIEVSADSMNTWSSLKNIVGLQYGWIEDSISLDSYCEQGKVYVRFSLVSDDVGTGNGWFLDDIWIAVDSSTLGIDRHALPNKYLLSQNFPNPFNSSTTISFSVEDNEKNTMITIYNFNGQKIKTLVDKKLQVGSHQVVWDGTDYSGNAVSSGIYFYKLECGDKYTGFKKMIMMR